MAGSAYSWANKALVRGPSKCIEPATPIVTTAFVVWDHSDVCTALRCEPLLRSFSASHSWINASAIRESVSSTESRCDPLRNASSTSVSTKMQGRSEEHTSELQSLMRISYAVFCLKKKKQTPTRHTYYTVTYISNKPM